MAGVREPGARIGGLLGADWVTEASGGDEGMVTELMVTDRRVVTMSEGESEEDSSVTMCCWLVTLRVWWVLAGRVFGGMMGSKISSVRC